MGTLRDDGLCPLLGVVTVLDGRRYNEYYTMRRRVPVVSKTITDVKNDSEKTNTMRMGEKKRRIYSNFAPNG